MAEERRNGDDHKARKPFQHGKIAEAEEEAKDKLGTGHLQEKPKIRWRLESKPRTTAPAQSGGRVIVRSLGVTGRLELERAGEALIPIGLAWFLDWHGAPGHLMTT